MDIDSSDSKEGTQQRKRLRPNSMETASSAASSGTSSAEGTAAEVKSTGTPYEDEELDFPEASTAINQQQTVKIENEEVKDFYDWMNESKIKTGLPRKEPLDENVFEILAKNPFARNLYKSSNIPDTIAEFKERFHKFTNKMFEGFSLDDWNGIVITGGTIVACMMAEIPDDCSTIFRNADIDIFLFGINDSESLSKKVIGLFKNMKRNIPGAACYAETPGTYSAYFISPYRPVQVIRTRYENLEDILSGFDVDCCAIAYQGPTSELPSGRLVSTKRAYSSLVFHRNIFKFEFRNERYENRLIKYARRGFEIWVLKKDWPNIDYALLDGMHDDQCDGSLKLAKYNAQCRKQPDFAMVEQRTRFVPFVDFSPEAFSTIFEIWKGRMDLSPSGSSAGELAHRYKFQAKASDITSSEVAKWPLWTYKRNTSPHPWKPVYQAKSLNEGLLKAKSRLTEARQWSEQHESVFLQKYFHAALPAADLHTHLGGMGSFEFWFKEIMNIRMRFRQYEYAKSKKDLQFHMVHWYGPRLILDNYPEITLENLNQSKSFWKQECGLTDIQITGPNMDNLLLKDLPKGEKSSLYLNTWRILITDKIWNFCVNNPNRTGVPFSSSLLKYINSSSAAATSAVTPEKLSSLYTHDVIITLEALILSIVDSRKEYPSIDIHILLGTKTNDFKECIYFNEMTQLFEYTEKGISTLCLYECVNEAENYQDSLENAFRYSCTGDAAANNISPSLKGTGLFTPDFYPNKFRLRKLLFEQDLRTLSLLLRHTLLEYLAANVNYVEYSFGLTDLLRPWIWPALLLYQNAGPFDIGVEYNFLAGFPRGLTEIKCSSTKLESIQSFQNSQNWKELESFILNCDGKAQSELVDCGDLSFEKLTMLCKQFEKYFLNANTQGGGLLRQYVVGFDLFGDEMGAPFIPFTDRNFLNFGSEAQKLLKQDAKNGSSQRFGFRIHCGEISAPPFGESNKLFCYKMTLATEALLSIAKSGIPVRIGHGVAFAECFRNKNSCDFAFINKLLDYCQARFRKRSSIAFEVNPISNIQLLQNASGITQQSEDIPRAKHVMHILSDPDLKLPICIGTDDDGVYNPTNGCVNEGAPIIGSVAYQFYFLNQRGLLEEKYIEYYKRCSQYYSFGKQRNP